MHAISRLSVKHNTEDFDWTMETWDVRLQRYGVYDNRNIKPVLGQDGLIVRITDWISDHRHTRIVGSCVDCQLRAELVTGIMFKPNSK